MGHKEKSLKVLDLIGKLLSKELYFSVVKIKKTRYIIVLYLFIFCIKVSFFCSKMVRVFLSIMKVKGTYQHKYFKNKWFL